MSIILASISEKAGVVASDGRCFNPTLLISGSADKPVTIKTDECDKTFEIKDAKIIGACCGLMAFSGKSATEHVVEAVKTSGSPLFSFCDLLAGVQEFLRTKLLQISPAEVIFFERKLDVLLIGRNIKGHLRIAALRFAAENDDIAAPAPEILVPDKANSFKLFGDERAQAATKHVMESNKAPNRDRSFLQQLAIRALKAGIEVAGPHPYGTADSLSCGGRIFHKHC